MVVHQRRQSFEIRGLVGIHPHVIDAGGERFRWLFVEIGSRDEAAAVFRDAGEEILTAHLLPGDADDAAVLMQLAISMAAIPGGPQLAHGEVPGAAKNNHIEWL